MSCHRCAQYARGTRCAFCGDDNRNSAPLPIFVEDVRLSDANAMWTDWCGPGETIGNQQSPTPRIADVLTDPAFARAVFPALRAIEDDDAQRLLCDLIRAAARPRWWQFYRRTIRR